MRKTEPETPPLPRVEPVEIDGRRAWLKRPEQLSGRMRLQKGDPVAAFDRERQAYRALQGKGLPIPEILDEGPDYVVTLDAGPTLTQLKTLTADRPEVFDAAMIDAARALGRFHRAGYSHGRPALKDICWQDGKVVFIDLERSPAEPAGLDACARDVMVFFFSAISETGGAGPAVIAAREAYRAEAPNGVWPRACARSRALRLRGLQMMLSPFLVFLRNKREFRAISPFFAFFRDG
ncbi:BUD32 family EKC/KEOPS complex subunit [Pseudodonghicola flavimaris]|uniref:tRNA A-37 threonylcarbamoyl transferase component Bud32 n=1 Tax=Pseudodonghicola flavimaris TaxID=3050036 RepID=A0ABT7F1L6_9RHOB|nr:hypothetical protein [Pseudodonghicola flavimaris]MDK3018465.1 hypothetical protein [Pseudodonghicola flavimaris]